jgi:hypothetical protein
MARSSHDVSPAGRDRSLGPQDGRGCPDAVPPPPFELAAKGNAASIGLLVRHREGLAGVLQREARGVPN